MVQLISVRFPRGNRSAGLVRTTDSSPRKASDHPSRPGKPSWDPHPDTLCYLVRIRTENSRLCRCVLQPLARRLGMGHGRRAGVHDLGGGGGGRGENGRLEYEGGAGHR